MKNVELTGEWKKGKNTIKVNLPVMIFEEDGVQIAYVPVLDISGYGHTEEEAKKSLNHCLNEYFSYTVNKNTLFKDLEAHGWKIRKKNKPFIAPEITDIINKNEYLHDIVNSRPYKMGRMDVDMPSYAHS
jgi:hypothetical protein